MMNTNQTTAADTQVELLARIRTEGVLAAYEASLAVCRDPKAPAAARATASSTLFRAAGLFDRKDNEETLEPHEMTPAQLASAVKRMERRLAGEEEIDVFT